MNILVINGSPKGAKSNTLQLTHAFLEGIGQDETTTLQLADMRIAPCRGCFACWKHTPGQCIMQDDMQGAIAALLAADVVIWSFPLYYYTVPGLLKNFIDRQLPMVLPFMQEREDGVGSGSHPNRHDMSGQRHVLLSTCGFFSAAGNYDAVRGMFDHICEKDHYEAIFCGQGELFSIPELRGRTQAYLEQVKHAGREYAAGGIKPETRMALSELLFPKDAFEAMADASWGVEKDGVSQADESLTFTRQMAALYMPSSYEGQDLVVEMHYTDIDRTYQMVLGKKGHTVLEKDFLSYTTRIETPLPVWQSISRGEITGSEALMRGQYRVLGDFSLMLRWDDLFMGGTANGQASHNAAPSAKKTSMLLLLMPWLATWIVLPIDTTVGAALGILAASFIPLLWHWYQYTIWEALSILAISGVSLAALLGVPAQWLLPISYAYFGVMWLVSGFLKIPLTAYYSLNNYGGDRVLNNPMFILTNRILTRCWGVLYVITAVVSWVLMGTPVAPYIGIVNNISPALMGMFTVWFQRWHPARMAKTRAA